MAGVLERFTVWRGIVAEHIGEGLPESGFVPGEVLFETVPAEKLGYGGDGGFEAKLAEPLDGLVQAVSPGKVSDLDLTMFRQGF